MNRSDEWPLFCSAICHRRGQLADAMRSSDLLALDKLISDDLNFIGPDGDILTKRADLEANRTGAMDFERIDETERRAFKFGGCGTTDTTAVAVLRLTTGPVTVRLLWHRDWQIVDAQLQVIAGSVVVLD